MSAKNTPVSELLGISIEKIKEMADVNAIIGEPIKLPDGTTIIPVSKVSFTNHSQFSVKPFTELQTKL